MKTETSLIEKVNVSDKRPSKLKNKERADHRKCRNFRLNSNRLLRALANQHQQQTVVIALHQWHFSCFGNIKCTSYDDSHDKMAACMTISLRSLSWKECCLSKKKGMKEFPRKLREIQGLLARGGSSSFMTNRPSFESPVDSLKDENFLLLPAGKNQVSIIQNCFRAGLNEEGVTTFGHSSVIGILGSRRTSPFKKSNVKRAVTHQTTVRVS